MSEKVVALIPARGGSKSIPRKNLIELGGKPLIAWSIEHALQSKLIERVIVSTDDSEIAEVASVYGAEVPFMRPSRYSTDDATDYDVFRHAAEWLIQNEGGCPDYFVHLRPTGPVRRVDLIDRAIKMMLANPSATSLRSVQRAHQTPYKMWSLVNNGSLMVPVIEPHGDGELHSMPRQSLPVIYWQNGYVDIVSSKTVLFQNKIVGDKVIPFVIDFEVRDLDYLSDIPLIEAELKNLEAGIMPRESDRDHAV